MCTKYSCTKENIGHLKFHCISETQLYQTHGTDTQWPQSTRTKLSQCFRGGPDFDPCAVIFLFV